MDASTNLRAHPVELLVYFGLSNIVAAALFGLDLTALGLYFLIIMSLFNSWIIIDSWRLYKGINANITPGNNLRQELQRNYDSFQRWWQLQERVALFINPIAVVGAFMLGGVAGSGRSLSEFLYKTPVLIVLAVCIVVLVSACYYFARWMFIYAFGKQLKKLKALIDEMEENGE
jgi:hypothetical protein